MAGSAALKQERTMSAYEFLSQTVGDELKKTDEIILKRLENQIKLIPQLAGHLISAGGKRIRPLLALSVTKFCGGDFSRSIPLAACIEFIHTATLLHDDVVDESAARRGQPSANALWGNPASVLVGDFLFGRSFELMVEDGHMDVLKILSRVSTIIIEGEILQLSSSFDLQNAREHYFDIIKSKTGALFSAACEVGAAVSPVELNKRKAMADYGTYLGMAFQCVDDLLDYFTDEETMGKKPGDDFREGKVTLPIILAYEAAQGSDKEFWEKAFAPDNQEIQFEDVQKMLEASKVYDEVLEVASHYATLAKQALEAFPNSEMKDAFVDLTNYMVERAY